jgi:UDP-N-acetylglucosamine 2-epimerase (non-hydrolysing)
VKLLFVFGTRPEAIKMAPIIQAARLASEFEVRVCVTGQHRQMLDQVLDLFCICPDHDLSVMEHDQDLSNVTARILERLRPVLLAERPNLMIVQGDTITAFAASLAAFYDRIPVAHVEAGLRTYNLDAPFPEEALRQMLTRLASLHFAPTPNNVKTLLREGVSPDRIVLTGNPVIDAVLWARREIVRSRVSHLSRFIDQHTAEQIERAEKVVLVTSHRRENVGANLSNICSALEEVARTHPRVLLVFPVHPNPRIREYAVDRLGHLANVLLLPPLDYPAFIFLMNLCHVVVTDSGGVQEEAPALRKPVIVTRESTERQEGLDGDFVRLAGANRDRIVSLLSGALRLSAPANSATVAESPYGDGRAAERIVAAIKVYLNPDTRFAVSLRNLAITVGFGSSEVPLSSDVFINGDWIEPKNSVQSRLASR